jgi:hypothetical protein
VQLKSIFFTLAEFLKNQVEIEGNYVMGINSERMLQNASRSDIRSMMSYDSSGNPKVRNEIKKNGSLNFDIFLDSLAIAALYTKFHEESSEIEKIIHLADRMCQSNGVMKSQMRSGQTL